MTVFRSADVPAFLRSVCGIVFGAPINVEVVKNDAGSGSEKSAFFGIEGIKDGKRRRLAGLGVTACGVGTLPTAAGIHVKGFAIRRKNLAVERIDGIQAGVV